MLQGVLGYAGLRSLRAGSKWTKRHAMDLGVWHNLLSTLSQRGVNSYPPIEGEDFSKVILADVPHFGATVGALNRTAPALFPSHF